jgi:lysophospholipase L1-like esterase
MLWGDRINVQYTTAALYLPNAYSSRTSGWRPGAVGSSHGKPVRINSLGLRGAEISLSKAEPKILLLGDSVLFGAGVEEENTMATLLQQALGDYCLINTAVIGYNMFNYVDVLAAWLEKTRLERVVLFLCINDVEDQPIQIQRVYSEYGVDFILAYLRAHSKLYLLLKDLISDRSRIYYEYDRQFYAPDEPVFQRALGHLRSLQQMCLQHQADFHVILLPYEFQLRNTGTAGIWQPQELMADSLRAMGIPYLKIDNLPMAKGNAKALYLFADGIHFSARGHYEIAPKVITYLKSLEP